MSASALGEVVLYLSPAELDAVQLSLRVAFWAMLGSLPFGLATAIVLARGRFFGKSRGGGHRIVSTIEWLPERRNADCNWGRPA